MLAPQDIPTTTPTGMNIMAGNSTPTPNNSSVDISKLPPRTFVSNKPIHTTVTQDIPNASGYFKLLLPAFSTRYLFRGPIDSQRNADMIKPLQTAIDKKWNIIQKAIDNNTPVANSLATSELRKSGYIFSAEEQLNHAVDKKSKILTQFKNNKLDSYYDNILGVGSLAVTASFESRVFRDIKNMFAETLAYETGKQPEEVTFTDFRHSKNTIVQRTLKNFRNGLITRLSSDLGFFGKQLSHLGPKFEWLNAVKFGDIMIGVKGMQLIADINKKETTILEDMLNLVDKKLNPVKGLGDSITSSDIIDLYQKYAIHDNKPISFKDSTIYQHSDDMKWPQAEKIFVHIADLMNQTYKYKHSSLDDISRIENASSSAIPKIDFTLPKFIYMLGEGNINPHKPEETYAKIEIAARFGSNSLKDANQMIRRGKSLEEILEKYPVDITPVQKVTGADGREEHYANLNLGTPSPKISSTIMHEPLQNSNSIAIQ